MSTSADSQVIIGFEVKHEDFWKKVDVTKDYPTCDNGHVKKEESEKFCSQCGSKFEIKSENKNSRTKNYDDFLRIHDIWEDIWPEEGLESFYMKNGIFDDYLNVDIRNIFKIKLNWRGDKEIKYQFGIFPGDIYYDYLDCTKYLIGVKISEIRNIGGDRGSENGDNITFIDDFNKILGSVKYLKDKLGFFEKKIGIYHT